MLSLATDALGTIPSPAAYIGGVSERGRRFVLASCGFVQQFWLTNDIMRAEVMKASFLSLVQLSNH